MTNLERPPVKRVRDALAVAEHDDTIVDLDTAARSADAAATALSCPLGAIVKSLVFCIDNRFVLALVAGDHNCIEDNLPKALNIRGGVRRPKASEVKGITGFSIGGVAPVGMSHPLPTVIDASLKRFDALYAAAGHPNCIFATTVEWLPVLTGGLYSYNISAPQSPENAYVPAFKRSKTFSGQN